MRYGIGKQTAINRRNHLGISPIKSKGINFITEADLALMDELHQFLQTSGAKMKDFPNPNQTALTETEAAPEEAITDTSDLLILIDKITEAVKPAEQTNPLNHLEQLEKAYENGWLLTTKEVHHLCGAKPNGSIWERGSFIFTKVGKIGAQSSWRVGKVM